MPKSVKEGSLSLRFSSIQCLAKFQKKIEGGPFGDFEKFSKKMRIFNSLIVPKNLKETLWDLLTFVLLQNMKKMKEGPFGTLKKFRLCETFFSKSLTKPKR